MSAHHEGGIHMASYTAENGDERSSPSWRPALARNQRIEIREYGAAVERLGR